VNTEVRLGHHCPRNNTTIKDARLLIKLGHHCPRNNTTIKDARLLIKRIPVAKTDKNGVFWPKKDQE